MRNAALALKPVTGTGAAPRREDVTQLLTDAVKRGATPEEIADLLGVDDQLAAHEHKISFLRSNQDALSEKVRLRTQEFRITSRRLDDHIRFTTEGLDEVRGDIELITEATNDANKKANAALEQIAKRDLHIDNELAIVRTQLTLDVDKFGRIDQAMATMDQRLVIAEQMARQALRMQTLAPAAATPPQTVRKQEPAKSSRFGYVVLWAGAAAAVAASFYSFIVH